MDSAVNVNAPVPEPVQAADITDAAIAMGEQPLATTPDPQKTFKFDPTNPDHQRLLKHIIKMQKQMAPKHENYPLCHKKCPLFKLHKCYTMDAAKQKACYESKTDLWKDQRVVDLAPCEQAQKGCQPNCLGCGKWKQCMKLAHNAETTIKVGG